jgi:hypothetical protein
MNDSKQLTPKELYPYLTELSFYQSLLSLKQYNILSIERYESLSDTGGKMSTMARVVLNIEQKVDSSAGEMEKLGHQSQLHLIVKAIAASPAVLMSCREVSVYEDVIQPLLDDFKVESRENRIGSKIYSHLSDNFTSIFPESVLSPNFPTKNDYLISRFVNREQFKAPKFYHGEINHETLGKCLILGQMVKDSGHSGCFFGNNIPHNDGYDITPMCDKYPNLTQIEVTKMAFCSIAKLHAKYWNNNFGNIPNYLPSFYWYFDTNAGEDDNKTCGRIETSFEIFRREYQEFIEFGSKPWNEHYQQRIQDGLKITPYFASICEKMLQISTPENFALKYRRSNSPATPVSIIHCDYFPHNSLISSSDQCDGITNKMRFEEEGNEVKRPHFFTIDYEFTCVSSPVQDLAQWAISQVNPDILAKYEEEWLELYYQQLEFFYYLYQHKNSTERNIGNNLTNQSFNTIYPFSQLKLDYIFSCTKWIWLVMCSMQLFNIVPVHMLQFFIDQIEAFMKRHRITTENITPCRR